MKTRLMLVCQTFLLLIVLVGSASAQPSGSLHVHIPFAFLVGDQTMPAGDYVISQEGHVGLLIIHGNGRSVAVISMPGQLDPQLDEAGVSFDRRGSDSYMARVRMPGQPARLIVGAQR